LLRFIPVPKTRSQQLPMSRLMSLLSFVRHAKRVYEPLVSLPQPSMIRRLLLSSISLKFFFQRLLASARAKVSPRQALLQRLLMEQDYRSCLSEFQVEWRRPVSANPIACRRRQH